MQVINERIKLVVATNNRLRRWAKAIKTSLSKDPHLLFKWASKGLKYLMLALFGCAIAYILSGVFGADIILKVILSSELWAWFLRIAVFIFCFFVVAIVYESSN